MPRGMPNGSELSTVVEPEPQGGCAFVLDADTRTTTQRSRCTAPCRPGSVYCAEHHAQCYLPSHSPAERRKLKEMEALAEAVGGRSGGLARRPSSRFLRRMDRISRAALRPERSCIVHNYEGRSEDKRGETR